MPYVYRYIDLLEEEVVYVGKVTKDTGNNNESLRKRHEQHCCESWYKDRADNIVMQYIHTDSNADADILETWLINYYDTGQLVNKAKTGWGKCEIDLSSCCFGWWQTWDRWGGVRESVKAEAEALMRHTESLTYNVEYYLNDFCDRIREIQKRHTTAITWDRYNDQEDFKRTESANGHRCQQSKDVQHRIIKEWQNTHKKDKRFIPLEAARLDGKPIIVFMEPEATEKKWSVQYAGNGHYFDTHEEALEYMEQRMLYPECASGVDEEPKRRGETS